MKQQPIAAVVVVLAAFAFGCGRSPAMPARAPVKMVHTQSGEIVAACACDDDDDDDAPVQAKPVEYVPVEEWRAPKSVQTFESKVAAQGPSKPGGYMEFPKLTLHKPIPETRFYTYRRGYYR